MPIRFCVVCNNEFQAKTTGKTCSETCRETHLINYRKNWYTLDLDGHRIDRKERSRLFKLNNPRMRMLHAAKSRAKISSLEFNLSIEDIIIPEICPVFKVPMKVNTPYAPSIDRIDSDKGYTKDNIQIISKKANTMKNNATKEELLKFSEWVNALT